MTTIIASRRPDGAVWFVSDRKLSYDDGSWLSCEKVRDDSGCRWAVAGECLMGVKLQYLLPGHPPDEPFERWFHRHVTRRWAAEDDDIQVLVSCAGRLFCCESDMVPQEVKYWRAIGSGSAYAAGHLFDGLSRPVAYPSVAAIDAAMRAASFYDSNTGEEHVWHGR
jgi:hypothetical protein